MMLKSNMFKLPKNRQFNYTPRYYKGKETDNPFDFDSAIRKDRESFSYDNVRAHWNDAKVQFKNRKNAGINSTLVIVFGILILIFMYIIDFDLGIFYKK